jgi:hypothetical protein
LARLLELNKKKAELEFRGAMGADCSAELRSIAANAAEIAAKAKAAGMEIVLPSENRLRAMGEALAAFSPQQLKEALVGRAGPAYDLLQQRGAIVRQNHDNRLEIAKLAIALARMPSHDRELVAAAVRSGGFQGTIALAFTNESVVKDAARFLTRCCTGCVANGRSIVADAQPGAEVRMELANRRVWVSGEVKTQLEENIRNIGKLTAGIQLKNAERQIKDFSEQEETEFEALQRRYLDLLKQQDELLREFNEEENSAFGMR